MYCHTTDRPNLQSTFILTPHLFVPISIYVEFKIIFLTQWSKPLITQFFYVALFSLDNITPYFILRYFLLFKFLNISFRAISEY